MSPTLRRRRLGFTLIELVAALSIGGVVLTATFQTYLLLRSQMVKTRVSAELRRNARNVLGTVSRYLKMAGAGLPPAASTNGDPDPYPGGGVPYGGAANPTIGPAVIVGINDAIGFMGDFPRPDSNLNGISVPAHAEAYQRYAYGGAVSNGCAKARRNNFTATDATNHLTLLNELSGGCLPGTGCDSSASSVLLPGTGSACGPGNLTAPTCPWSLKKYRPSEYVLLVYPSRKWLARQINAPAFNAYCASNACSIHTHCDGPGQFQGLSLFYEAWGGHASAGSGGRNIPNTMGAGWLTDGANVSSMVFPSNRGWVSTIERVFFRYRPTTSTMEFIMCWGPPARGDATWTQVAAANPCALAAGSGIGGAESLGGTGWQVLARNVKEVKLEYFDDDNTLLAAPGTTEFALAQVARVGVSVTLERQLPTEKIITTESTSIQLRSRRF